jgi:integrase
LYALPGFDPEAAYKLAIRHTAECIDWYADWRGLFRDQDEKSINQVIRDVTHVFSIEMPDPNIGRDRCLTVFDFMRPGGDRLAMRIKLELEDLRVPDTVIARHLRALRVFCRHIEDHPPLIDGRELSDIYGRLSCPIEDRDIKKIATKKDVRLPTPGEMPGIYDAVSKWAWNERRFRWQANRSSAALISSFGCGLRGVSQRQLSLDNQVFDRNARVPRIDAPMSHLDTKTGRTLKIIHDPYPLEYLNYWLAEVRPQQVEAMSGLIYPPIGRGSSLTRPMSPAAFSEAMKRPLRYLRDRGLIDPKFTFHAVRATFATHYLEEHNSIADLLNRVGWSSISAAAHYIKPDSVVIAEGSRGYRRTLGKRR